MVILMHEVRVEGRVLYFRMHHAYGLYSLYSHSLWYCTSTCATPSDYWNHPGTDLTSLSYSYSIPIITLVIRHQVSHPVS
jgi:hypothetical protein